MKDLRDFANQWQDEGWVLVPDLIPTDVIDEASEELWHIFPRPEEFHALDHPRQRSFKRSFLKSNSSPTTPSSDDVPAFREEQFRGFIPFPFPSRGRLNDLLVHPRLIEFSEMALGSQDIRLYQSALWAKYAGTANYAQPLHIDRNHSIVPPRPEPGWWHTVGFLFLNDVDENNGATELLRRHDSPTPYPGTPLLEEDAPAQFEKLVSVKGKRGSYFCYRTDLWHRAINLIDPLSARFSMIASFKLAGHDWINYDGLGDVIQNWHFERWVERRTPRELELLGVPPPGHPYWTPSVVDAFSQKYPRLNVAPWRQAI